MKAIGKLLAAEVIMICLGFVLLVFSYLIPKDAMENHVRESVKVFEEEGTYPQLVAGFVDSQLDNWTDALMLLTAVYQDSENNVLRQAVLNKRSVIEGKKSRRNACECIFKRRDKRCDQKLQLWKILAWLLTVSETFTCISKLW